MSHLTKNPGSTTALYNLRKYGLVYVQKVVQHTPSNHVWDNIFRLNKYDVLCCVRVFCTLIFLPVFVCEFYVKTFLINSHFVNVF